MTQNSDFSDQVLDPFLNCARRIAEDRLSSFVATEHLFLAVLQTADNSLIRAFNQNGVTTKSFENEIEQILKSAKTQNQSTAEPSLILDDKSSMPKTIELAPKANSIIAVAKQRSQDNSRNSICAEDILLALAADENCLTFKALQNLGLDLRRFKNEHLHH